MASKEEEWEIIGKSIGIQLKDLNKNQLTIAQKLISDTIFYAKIGKLCEESCISLRATQQCAVPTSSPHYQIQSPYPVPYTPSPHYQMHSASSGSQYSVSLPCATLPQPSPNDVQPSSNISTNWNISSTQEERDNNMNDFLILRTKLSYK